MNRILHRSPLTASQEKLLLAKLEKARPNIYRYKDPPKPKAVIAAEKLIREYSAKMSEANQKRSISNASAYHSAREAVIFAETKDAAQKAVDAYIAAVAKESKHV